MSGGDFGEVTGPGERGQGGQPPGGPAGHPAGPPGEAAPPGPYAPPLPAGYGMPGQPRQFGPPLPPLTPAPVREPRSRRRTAALVAAVVAALLVAAGGVYVVAVDRGDRGDTASADAAPAPAGTAAVDQGDGKGPGGPPHVYDPNAGIKPGEARVWFSDNRTELTRSGAQQYGPWRVGEVVVRAMFKEIVGHGVSDGQEKWKVSLETPLCGVPQGPAASGKLVVGVRTGDSPTSRCTHLQQIDLTTGTAGWKVEVPQENSADFGLEYAMAISGDTVAVARSAVMSGFSVTDGRKLFGTSKTGNCTPAAFGGGARLIGVRNCFAPGSADNQVMIQDVDPATGQPRWSYQYPQGWSLGRILSLDPLVVAGYHSGQKAWNITVFHADGTIRSQTDMKFAVNGRCNGWGNGLTGLQACDAAVADADTLYIAGGKPGKHLGIDEVDEVVAVDLNTGQEKWHAAAPKGRTMWPLAIENGALLLYVEAGAGEPGEIATLPPGGGTPQVVLRSPAMARGAQSVFFSHSVRLAWSGGRLFLLKGTVRSPEPTMVDHAILSFGR
ncbi:PQQ-binding-like beta-propeller repeat protein [Streptomyces sp. NPDC090022]|uniref:outer membrane protein assembly factor BamB family protein n=1 Tax=Streptomyces sp. NPDC090022 TaxID=3365920 RepID=UPI0037F7CC82